MAQYIHFTDEQKQRAAEVDLEEFLRRRGEKLLPSGRDKRLDSDHSVTIRGCEWFDHDSRQGGNAISFVRWFYHYSYQSKRSWEVSRVQYTLLLLDGRNRFKNHLNCPSPIPICGASLLT